MKNNSLRYLSESLAKQGIVTLRSDKLGIGQRKIEESESELRFENYIDDVQKWIETLRQDSRFSKIVLIGHNEGSLIGMVAARQILAENLSHVRNLSAVYRAVHLTSENNLGGKIFCCNFFAP